MHKLPAGEYYIGDPCYVFEGKTWDQILEETDSFQSGDIQHFNGFDLWAASTQWGDGTYCDQNGIEYPVDSGLLGIIPLGLIDNPEGLEHGTVIKFPKDVTVDFDNGMFWFGHIRIDTDNSRGSDPDDGGYDLDPDDDVFLN